MARQFFIFAVFLAVAASAWASEKLSLAPGLTVIQQDAQYRISGIVPPQAASERMQAESWLSEQFAAHDWRKMTSGRADRYGRREASWRDETGRDLADAMLDAGMALADAAERDASSFRRHLAHEYAARQARRGLWVTPPVFSAEQADQAIGRYAIIEGRLRHLSYRKGSAYLDFGEDWRSDTTAFIPASCLSRFPPGWLETLEGRRIAMRGWIESRHGPSLALLEPWAIEPL